MKLDDKFYIGRDSKGLFKWNEKEFIRIEDPKTQKNNEKSKSKPSHRGN